jgi:hypothetical protein
MQQRPSPLAALALIASRAGLGALGAAPASSSSKGKNKGPSCTPCAAQARKDAAQAYVRGSRGGA